MRDAWRRRNEPKPRGRSLPGKCSPAFLSTAFQFSCQLERDSERRRPRRWMGAAQGQSPGAPGGGPGNPVTLQSAPSGFWRLIDTCRRGRAIAPGSRSLKKRAVGVQRRLTAQVRIEHGRTPFDLTSGNEIDETSHRLALIDRVSQHALESRC